MSTPALQAASTNGRENEGAEDGACDGHISPFAGDGADDDALTPSGISASGRWTDLRESAVENNAFPTCLRVVCANPVQSEHTATPGRSIRAECAQASGCSHVSTAKLSVVNSPPEPPNAAPTGLCGASPDTPGAPLESAAAAEDFRPPDPDPDEESSSESSQAAHLTETRHDDGVNTSANHLCWDFKNGRLVFDVVKDDRAEVNEDSRDLRDSQDSQERESIAVLNSKELNRRRDGGNSRLRLLEVKLKQAGILDGYEDAPRLKSRVEGCDECKCHKYYYRHPEQVVDVDSNQNLLKKNGESFLSGACEKTPFLPTNESACEFDVYQVGTFAGFSGYCEMYDELEGCEERAVISGEETMRDGSRADAERVKHNPDSDNLKSLLKRSGKGNREKRGNRVVFNEKKNEFFDADYIILIREECEYDDEDDDGVCTCNQHEMVRLTCCETNCGCNVYEGFEFTPQSPKFAPPLEFVDVVTLSPPEGYKDMELGEQQLLALQQQVAKRTQRTAVCRECSESAIHNEEHHPGSDQASAKKNDEELEEKHKTDQSQQTTPTTPLGESDGLNSQQHNLSSTSKKTLGEQLCTSDDEKTSSSGESPINGILKGGRLWKQQSVDTTVVKPFELQPVPDTKVMSDDESSSRRSVRFTESSSANRDVCDGAAAETSFQEKSEDKPKDETTSSNPTVSPESTEMMLTFKLGNHVLISNNSLKPNSAVRQLFPCTEHVAGDKDDASVRQFLVTAESLRAFEEAKRSKLPQIINSGEIDDSIRRAIERNTLRRSLIRYEPRSKKNVQKVDNSLVERIKQLTCDIEDVEQEPEEVQSRVNPAGEEVDSVPAMAHINFKNHDKSFSPSSSSTSSSSSSSASSTYKKITDLFGKRVPDFQETPKEFECSPSMPDLGNGLPQHFHHGLPEEQCKDIHGHVNKANSNSIADSKKQFLSSLAPLTACVSGMGPVDEYYYMSNHIEDRTSMASTISTEYSLEDIEAGLKNVENEDAPKNAPDVLAGTPSASDSGDELAVFVQQDAGRIERLKKKYQAEPPTAKADDEDDEHDDYGFNRRPSVRGIKPRFGSSTEILQQIQNQLQPPVLPPKVAWPYYSESGLTSNSNNAANAKSRNINQHATNYNYPPGVPEPGKARNVVPPAKHQSTSSFGEENLYENCANQRCREVYNTNVNQAYVAKNGCTDYYQTYARRMPTNGRPQSPPPLDMSKKYHQTMVYIPYNHIESYQQLAPSQYYHCSDYARVSNHNQINKRFIEPIYQQRPHYIPHEEHYSALNSVPVFPAKSTIRFAFTQQQTQMVSRVDSPLAGQFSTARATQTNPAHSCNYYMGNPRFKTVVNTAVWHGDDNYVSKSIRQTYPAASRCSNDVSVSDGDNPMSAQLLSDIRQPNVDSTQSSPTKPKFIERGAPEGAASVPSGDCLLNNSNMSPSSPQNPPPISQKPMFYAMNV